MAKADFIDNFSGVNTNASFDRQQFGIKDMRIVMSLLSKLYSNPIQSLTQEYICNGRDANREVKSKKPIEVTLPTSISPILKIRDYGPGLSPDRIEEVFLFYGTSTKSYDDNQTGNFGISVGFSKFFS